MKNLLSVVALVAMAGSAYAQSTGQNQTFDPVSGDQIGYSSADTLNEGYIPLTELLSDDANNIIATGADGKLFVNGGAIFTPVGPDPDGCYSFVQSGGGATYGPFCPGASSLSVSSDGVLSHDDGLGNVVTFDFASQSELDAFVASLDPSAFAPDGDTDSSNELGTVAASGNDIIYDPDGAGPAAPVTIAGAISSPHPVDDDSAVIAAADAAQADIDAHVAADGDVDGTNEIPTVSADGSTLTWAGGVTFSDDDVTAHDAEFRCSATGREQRTFVTEGATGPIYTAWYPAPPVITEITVAAGGSVTAPAPGCYGDHLIVTGAGTDYETQQGELTGSFVGSHRVAGPQYAVKDGAFASSWIRPGEEWHFEARSGLVWSKEGAVTNDRHGSSATATWVEHQDGTYDMQGRVIIDLANTGIQSEIVPLPFAVANFVNGYEVQLTLVSPNAPTDFGLSHYNNNFDQFEIFYNRPAAASGPAEAVDWRVTNAIRV